MWRPLEATSDFGTQFRSFYQPQRPYETLDPVSRGLRLDSGSFRSFWPDLLWRPFEAIPDFGTHFRSFYQNQRPYKAIDPVTRGLGLDSGSFRSFWPDLVWRPLEATSDFGINFRSFYQTQRPYESIVFLLQPFCLWQFFNPSFHFWNMMEDDISMVLVHIWTQWGKWRRLCLLWFFNPSIHFWVIAFVVTDKTISRDPSDLNNWVLTMRDVALCSC